MKWFAMMAVLVACGEALPRTSLVANPNDASPEYREACALTERKCTRCHTLGRIFAADARTREDWEPVVLRMRRMVSSGITESEVPVILRCLGEKR